MFTVVRFLHALVWHKATYTGGTMIAYMLVINVLFVMDTHSHY